MSQKTSIIHHIQYAASVLILGTILANGLSFLKSLFIASYYGTSSDLDAYFLSLTPLRLFSGILLGAIQAALIPKYLELHQQKGKSIAFAVFLTFSVCIILAVFLISILFIGGSDSISTWLGPGFTNSQRHLTASLLKISTVLLCCTLVNGIGVALFHAHRQFILSAWVPLLNGICSLGYIIYFRGQGVYSLMYGLILGMSLEAGITLFAARRFLPKHLYVLSPLHIDVKHTSRLLFPMLLGASFGHVNGVVDQIMASTLPSGSIAALHYAGKLHNILTQIFITVVAQAAFPFLAQQVAEGKFDAMKRTYWFTVKKMLYILLPLTVGILFAGRFMVQLVFQRGAFTMHSTMATAGAWRAYTLGLPIQAVRHLMIRVYNALQKNDVLMYVAAGSIGLNILCNWILMRILGHIGIALSTALVYWITTGILGYILNQDLKQRCGHGHDSEK